MLSIDIWILTQFIGTNVYSYVCDAVSIWFKKAPQEDQVIRLFHYINSIKLSLLKYIYVMWCDKAEVYNREWLSFIIIPLWINSDEIYSFWCDIMIAIIGSHIKNSTKTKLLQNDMVGQQHARITGIKYENTKRKIEIQNNMRRPLYYEQIEKLHTVWR